MRTQPFGAARSPANWERVPRFAQLALALLCGVDLKVYAGDCICIEPEATCRSAFHATKGFGALLGLALEKRKECHQGEKIDLLGAHVVLSHDFVEASFPAHKKEQLLAGLKQALSSNVSTPVDAAKWRGRLGFAQSLTFGRMGRSLQQPFSDRQYASGSSRKWALPGDLKEALPWWIARISNSGPPTTTGGSTPEWPRRLSSTPTRPAAAATLVA